MSRSEQFLQGEGFLSPKHFLVCHGAPCIIPSPNKRVPLQSVEHAIFL